VRRTLPLLLVSLLALPACKSGDGPKPTPTKVEHEVERKLDLAPDRVPEPKPVVAGVSVELANETKICQRTLCIGGPGEPSSEANVDLADLCRRAPGVLRRCEDGRCTSAWSTDEWRRALDELIRSLDLDANGKVDADDPLCTINVAGWSTGAALLAGPLVEGLIADGRVSPERAKVERMVLAAPWKSDAAPTFTIPDAVRNAWIYRNTLAPADDCSAKWESGPWLSPKPICGAQTNCWDYDYSLEPALAFVSRRGARSGAAIGHCNLMGIVAKIAPDNLARGIEAKAEHVPRLSDGRPGGRPHEPDPNTAP